MDVAGAENLRWRIEQQQHWRQASAVLDGRQPSADPDVEQLETFEEGLRVYSVRATRDGLIRICKRLVNGFWEHGTMQETLPEVAPETKQPAVPRLMARVA